MEIYKIGKIISKNKNYIILENNYTGYMFQVPNIDDFEKDETRKVYIFKYSSEYYNITFGFKTFKERILFEDLISVNGIGPKTAISLLSEGTDRAMQYISEGNWEMIAKFPYISTKSAKQLIFEFETKYKKLLERNNFSSNVNSENSANEIDEVVEKTSKLDSSTIFELEDTLKVLGFKKKQISYAINNLNPNGDFEALVEEAIKLISSAREFRN